MNPFYAIRNFLRGPGAPPVETGLQTGLPAYPTTVNREVTFDTAMQISAVWACCRLIAESIASLPFALYEVDENGERTEMSGDLARVLCQQPNQYQTKVEFWETMALNLAVSGNAYAVKQRSGGRLVGLLPLSSQQVETDLLKDGTVVHRYTQGEDVKVYASDSIWHVKLFGNGIVGMSPLSYANNSINIAQNADTRVNKMYSNGAKPSGVLMIDRTLTDEQRAQIKSNFIGLESGNSDRLFVLEAGMQYQQISMTPQDIQLLDSRRFQIEDIGRFFGVPSVLLNQTFGQSSLGSNVQEILSAFYKLNLRPYLEKFEASILRWLVDPKKRNRIEARFDFDALLRADTLSRMQANREAINSGQMTPNEARMLEGRSALPGGDKLLIQGAMVPVEQAGQQPEPEPTPPDDPEPDPMLEEMMEEMRSIKAARAEYKPAEPMQFNLSLKTEPHVTVTSPDMVVNVENTTPEVVVENNIDVPEQKMEAPVVNVTNEVQPADVTVIDNHPKRAVQTVERDADGEIIQTNIDYE